MDAESKALLEKEIAARALELLGTTEHRILLPPPPQVLAEGALEIGTVKYLDRSYSFGLNHSEMLQHIGIYGRSGSGKTNAVFCLLKGLDADQIPFLFLDTKRTVRHLLPKLSRPVNFFSPGRSLSRLPFDFMIPPPGLDLGVYISLFVDLLGASYTLGDGSKSLLHRVLLDAYEQCAPWPSISHALSLLQTMETTGRATGWRSSAVRALESLSVGLDAQQESIDQTEFTRRLTTQSTILELDGLSESAQQFLVSLLMQWLFYYRLQSCEKETLRIVVIFEEAHNFFYRQENRSKESILNRFLRQCREVGIGVVIVDQNLSLISKAAAGNSYTSIAMSMKEPSDVSRMASMLSLRDDQKRYLNMLSVGEGIVKLQGRRQRPFLVQFPKVDVEKGSVSDALLSRCLHRGRVNFRGVQKSFEEIKRTPTTTDRQHDERDFLADCAIHAMDGVQRRYKRLRFSIDKGTRIKNSLLDRKLIEASQIQVGRAIRQVVRPTELGLLLLGLGPAVPRESIPHSFWKEHYARELRAAGYDAVCESARHGGRVDVLGTKGDHKIAIEIETGKSNVAENVRNCLDSNFSRTVVVATTEAALKFVERTLAAHGLLRPDRVRIVLRDEFHVPTEKRQLA